ncbi:MAG: DNA-directed RNA polymerase subunit omega, partial [Chitinophagaceae bacterium]
IPMSRLRRQIGNSITNNLETKDVAKIKQKTGNVYESIAIISKRANQINIMVKEELHNKLEEFASHTDSLEEIHENKEQIEISKAYEKMPNPSLLATQEFMEDKVYYRRSEDNLFI